MNYAIILSGGRGTRLGLDMPKQYYEVNKRPIIRYVIETIEQSDKIDGFVIVIADEWKDYVRELISVSNKFIGFALPGENRQLSIYSGLCYLKNILMEKKAQEEIDLNWDDVVVLIQDAARPNTSINLIEQCLDLKEDEDGAMPVLPMKDTVYLSEDGMRVSALLERRQVFAGQAPESFRFGKYLAANEALLPGEILKINGSTEPAILSGMQIKMIPGDEKNYKITTEIDLKKFIDERNIVKI